MTIKPKIGNEKVNYISNTELLRAMKSFFKTDLYKTEQDLKKIKIINIYGPGSYHAGLELAGKYNFRNQNMNSVILWGSIESIFLDSLNDAEAEKAILKIFQYQPPLIFLSKGFNGKWRNIVKKIGQKENIGVIETDLLARHVAVDIYNILAPFFAPNKILHASAIVVNNVGILVMGEPGIGKSEALVELIYSGHTFIGDDSIDVRRIGSSFLMESSAITKHLLEVRGIGIIDVVDVFGYKNFIERHSLHLVLELKHFGVKENFNRIDFKIKKYQLLGAHLPLINIPVAPGRNLGAMIELAANAYRVTLKKNYVSPVEKIHRRTLGEIND